jgi:organic radical activating enzyme
MNERSLVHRFEDKLRQRGVFSDVVRTISGGANATTRPMHAFFASDSPQIFGPLSVNLDLTVACNYRCPHCIDGHVINTKKQIELDEIYNSLLNLRLAGLRSVILIGGGEPVAHPNFHQVVELIKALGLQCAIVSNGSLNGRIAQIAHLLEDKDWIRLSLDAGSNKVFQALHRPVARLTLDDICKSAQEIKQHNPELHLGYSFIVIGPESAKRNPDLVENWREIPLAAERAKSHGFDFVAFKACLERDSDAKEVLRWLPVDPAQRDQDSSLAQLVELLAEARHMEDADFKVFVSNNLIALMSGETDRPTPQPNRCLVQKLRHVITPLGVYACPAYRGDRRSYLGDKNSFASLKAFKALSARVNRQINGFDAAQECRDICCIYNSTNWWLSGLDEDPDSTPLSGKSPHGADVFL